jgi:energy-coupling factor transporter ATP-binding protein EcfA2
MTNNSPSPGRLPVLISFLLAVGVIPAAAWAFTYERTQNPWQALGLALLFAVVNLILGFVFRVWQKLESRWVDRIVEWMDTELQAIFSGYHKRYLEHLVYRHRAFDVKGLTTQGIYTLELERIFVELTVAPQALQHVSVDPIRKVPESLREGRHIIWDYLQSEQMAGQNLAIIGPPGSGKTTLLQHMTLTLAADKKRRWQANAPDKLPILLFLRNHAQDIQAKPNLSLVQAVQNSLTKWDMQAPSGWFETHLKKGHCLVMLDGLDEVADAEAREQVVKWVEQQMVVYAKNRFVITSRPHGYRTSPLRGVTVLAVRPFSHDQVRRFIHNWYLANEVMSAQKDDLGVRMDAREGAEDLLRRIRSSGALSDMAVNPLLVTMISTVHRYRSALPERRVELYDEICDAFLGTRQQARGLPPALDLTPAQKQGVLQPLAYHMMCQERREIPLNEALKVIAEPLTRVTRQVSGKEFLQTIENTSGLLLERGSGIYSFAHLTFQEFLASMHVYENNLHSELIPRVEDSWWHESILLFAAKADASSIIEACLTSEPPSVLALTLAIACGQEARYVAPELRDRLGIVLNQEVEDPDPERRHIVAQSLLALRLGHMTRVEEDKYVDSTPITHAEYQIFLDEQLEWGKHHQPDHWLHYKFPAGQGQTPVVGIRPSDAVAFCDWLTQREPENLWRYRLPRSDEIDVDSVQLKDDIQTWLKDGGGYWCSTGELIECARPLKSEPVIEYKSLEQQLADDLKYASDDVQNPNSGLKQDLEIACELALDRPFRYVLHCSSDLVRSITRALSLVASLASSISREAAQAREQGRELQNERGRIPEQEHDLESRLTQARKEESVQERKLARVRNLEQNLKRRLTQAHEQESILKRNLAQVRVQTSNLETQYNKAVWQEQNIWRDEELYSQAQDMEIRLAHIQAQERDLEGKLREIQRSRVLKKLGFFITGERRHIKSRLTQTREQAHDLRGRLIEIRQKIQEPEEMPSYVHELRTRLGQTRTQESELDSELARTSQQISNLDSELAQVRLEARRINRELAQTYQEISDLDRRLATVRKLDLSLTLASELAQGLQIALNILSQEKLTSALTSHVFYLDRVEDLEIILTGVRGMQTELSNLSSKLCAITQEHEPVDNIKTGIHRLGNLARKECDSVISDLESFIKQIYPITSALRQTLNPYSTVHLERTLDICLEQDYDDYVFRSLIRALKRFRDLARTPTVESDIVSRGEAMPSFLRRHIRLCAFVLATELLSSSLSDSSSLSGRFRQILKSEQDDGQRLLGICLNLYVNFTILEERIKGKLPAFEGIWLVKVARA